MDAGRIQRDLEAVSSEEDFAGLAYDLVEAWTAAGAGLDAVEPILRFMEAHPDTDYGTPGGLVHFMERFHGRGYDRLLLDSLARRPTPMTTWMLNRMINGTHDVTIRGELVAAMERAASHPEADEATVEEARHFLEDL